MRLRTVLRWSARLLAGTVGLALLAAGTGYGVSERRLHARFDVPDHPLVVRGDPATIARGEHVATIRGCVECHGAGLRGNVLVDDAALGRLVGPNLTRGGRGAALEPVDWERAVRHAVRRDGTPLLVMPAHEFNVLTDEDLAAIVAYARSLPAVTEAPPPSRAGPLARALHLAGQLDLVPAELIDHRRPHQASLPPAPTAEYGAYVASGCVGCHGPGLSGGKIPGTPPDWRPAANITPAGIGHWTEADFVTALRTGRRPDGSRIDDSAMPIKLLGKMTDVELKAVYAYLRTVPAKPFGNR